MSKVLKTVGAAQLNRMFIDYYGRTKSQKRAFVHLAYELDRMSKADHNLEEKIEALAEQHSELLDIVKQLTAKISTLENNTGAVVQPKRKPGRPRKET
mgnify:CR=1 FL=1